jgi:hypothetical protein
MIDSKFEFKTEKEEYDLFIESTPPTHWDELIF